MTSTVLSTAQTISGLFDSLVAVPRSLTTFYEGQDQEPEPTGLWASVSVAFDRSNQQDMGDPTGRRFRTTGVMSVVVLNKPGVGDADILTTIDAIIDAFRAKTIVTGSGASGTTTITFRSCYPVGPMIDTRKADAIVLGLRTQADNSWVCRTVQAPFYFDDYSASS